MVTLSLVMTGWGAKSTTCSFRLTRLATRSIKGTLIWTPTPQVVWYAPRRSTTKARDCCTTWMLVISRIRMMTPIAARMYGI